jgi:hypothetical protein
MRLTPDPVSNEMKYIRLDDHNSAAEVYTIQYFIFT